MYNRINIVNNFDGTYDLHISYSARADVEYGMDFLSPERLKTNIINIKTYLKKHLKNIKIKSVKILVDGAIIATLSFTSFMNVYGSTPKYSMAYLYSGTTTQQISYINRTNGALNTVSPTYFDIETDGTLTINSISTQLVDHAHSQGMKVVPFLSNHWNQQAGINALNNSDKLTTQIANTISQYNLDGINIDIEHLTENQKDALTDFVAMLRAKIPADKEVSVAVAANPNGWTEGWHGSYDYTKLAQNSDYLMIMAYDESWQGSLAGPVSSISFVENSIKYALTQTTADKIVIGMPFYGRIWSDDNNFNGNGITLDRINQLITDYNAEVIYDTTFQSVKATFTVSEASPVNTLNGKIISPGTYTIWYENESSIQAKMNLVNEYELKGVGAWALGQEPSNIWENYSSWLNPTNTQPTPPIATSRTGIVTATKLNVRSGPGINNTITTTLNQNETVNILYTDNRWHTIAMPNNGIGYVSSEYINETTPKEETSQTQVVKKGLVTATKLNVRSGPSINTRVISTLTENTSVDITDTNNGWHTIKLSNGQIGYVSSTYINVIKTSDSTISRDITSRTGTVNTAILNVRSGPSTQNKILTTIKRNTPVEILSTSNGWHNIRLANGQLAYVSSAYISTTNQSPISSNKTGIVNASVLNVRSGPSTNTSILSTIKKGDLVEILSTNNGWHNIRLSNGQLAYVSSNYITESTTNTPTSSIKTGFVSTSVLNVRSGPSTNTNILSTLEKGDLIEILSTNNGWHNIKLPNGQLAYVSSNYISDTPTTKTGIVNTAVLNVRSGPSTRYKVLTTIRRNSSVEILSTNNGWHNVRLPNGETGYVSSSFIR